MTKSSRTEVRELFSFSLDRSGNLAGAHAPGADIHVARGTVYDRLDTFHVGLPGTVGTPVRVRDLDAEGHAFAAILALSHPLHLPAVMYCVRIFISTDVIITGSVGKCKKNFQNVRSFFARSPSIFFRKVLRVGETSYIMGIDARRTRERRIARRGAAPPGKGETPCVRMV